jgi:hypothetical protein
MAMILPPVIRPYWSTLTAEKAAAEGHREWEWDSDPFKAKHEVEARQGKKKEKERVQAQAHADGEGGGSGRSTPGGAGASVNGGGGRHWEEAPEVRMAPALREQVEGTVRKVGLIRELSDNGVDDAAVPIGRARSLEGNYIPYQRDLDAYRARCYNSYETADHTGLPPNPYPIVRFGLTRRSHTSTFPFILFSQGRSPCTFLKHTISSRSRHRMVTPTFARR